MLANIKRSNGTMTVFVKGKPFQIAADAERMADITQAVETGDEKAFLDIVDKTTAIEERSSNIRFNEGDGRPYFKDRPISDALAARLIDMAESRSNLEPFENFLDNLYLNPSKRAIDETYRFMQANDLPMTNDGCLLAYKSVTSDFKDKYSRSLDNSPGALVDMPRNAVNDDPTETCSDGLHFCSISYLRDFYWGSNDKLVAVKVNPKDIVSIPIDYNNSKARCCEYTVVEELDSSIIHGTEEWSKEFCEEETADPAVPDAEFDPDAEFAAEDESGEHDEDGAYDPALDDEADDWDADAHYKKMDHRNVVPTKPAYAIGENDEFPIDVVALVDLGKFDVAKGTLGVALKVAGTGSVNVRWMGKNLPYWTAPEAIEKA